MAKDAEAHAAEDKEAKEKIEARNQLDSMVYNVEKMLKEGGEKVDAADKSEVETALADAKTTLTGDPSVTELNAAREAPDHGEPQAGGGAVQGQRRRGDGSHGRRCGCGRHRRRGQEGRGRDRRGVCRRGEVRLAENQRRVWNVRMRRSFGSSLFL